MKAVLKSEQQKITNALSAVYLSLSFYLKIALKKRIGTLNNGLTVGINPTIPILPYKFPLKKSFKSLKDTLNNALKRAIVSQTNLRCRDIHWLGRAILPRPCGLTQPSLHQSQK